MAARHLHFLARAPCWTPLTLRAPRPQRAAALARQLDRHRRCSTQGDSELNPETVSYLVDRAAAREVYLVGTAHVSEASAEDVRHTIAVVRPHHVMIELCAERARRLQDKGKPRTVEEIARDFLQQLMQHHRGAGFGVEVILKTGLSAFYAFLRQMGLVPGTEFKMALEEAERLNIKVCLGDRKVDETMRRLRIALTHTSFQKVMHAPPPPPELVGGRQHVDLNDLASLTASVESLKNRRQIRLLREYMDGVVPDIMKTMVQERDRFMTDKLMNDCGVGRTVAVVGMAHMDGIEEEWRARGGEVFLHADNSLR